MRDWPGSSGGRRRVLAFALFCVLCFAATAAYIVRRAGDREAPPATPGTAPGAPDLDRIRAGPHVYYRSARRDEFGRVVVASLLQPDAERVVSGLSCDRVAFGRERGLCLVDNRGQLQPPGLVHLVDGAFRVLRTAPLAGVPSRARVAADGRHGATTVFVTGENYASSLFSTRTHVIDLTGATELPDLEQFVTTRDGQTIRADDFNFWGVTFTRDSDVFYATLATAGHTYLVEGRVVERALRALKEGVECPSLSPDGTHIAFKRRIGRSLQWRLHVLDRATLREWPVAAETRTIDDQVEWLDADHVLYGFLDAHGLPETAQNVWVASIREGASDAPRVFLRGASSPTVVHPAMHAPR